MTKKQRRDVYQEITDRILEQLKSADAKWRRPWRTLPGACGLPVNLDGRSYRGINVPILMSRDSASNVWATYRRWQKAGAQVRRGEKGTMIVFWKFSKVKDADTGEEKTVPFARGYTVFSAEQVDGFDLDEWRGELPPEPERIESAERASAEYLEREGVKLEFGGDRAFYAPAFDAIRMPRREAFKDAHGYYATLLHEITHSTGREDRLDRKFGKRFGDEAYAFEELVAELGAAMLCGAIGIASEPREDHAKYLASWIKVLEGDKRAIFTAASRAQAAADFVLKSADADEELDEAA